MDEQDKQVDRTDRSFTTELSWSLRRVPLVPGYWCVCVGPLREEWGDYAGKIFLAKASILFYPPVPPA